MKKVILEGCNGGWAQKRYLPILISKAAEGEIDLWAVDIHNRIRLTNPKIKRFWQDARDMSRAHYLKSETRSYNELCNADYVFIVVPDRFHCKVATFWLDRLGPNGKIFIEKPLDACLLPAVRLKKKIEEKEKKEAVFAFDHYLARVYPFLCGSHSFFRGIEEVTKVEFHILEASEIPPERVKALDKGVIFDLFPHALAIVYAVIRRNSTCLTSKLQAVKMEEVKAARYTGCPISGESFAWIRASVKYDIKVVSTVGKCVGIAEDKSMGLYGSNGNIKLDFTRDEFFVFDSAGKKIKKGRLNSNHVQSFLERVLQGKEHPLLAPGVLSADAAFDILRILDGVKKQIGEMLEYKCNESVNKILAMF